MQFFDCSSLDVAYKLLGDTEEKSRLLSTLDGY